MCLVHQAEEYDEVTFNAVQPTRARVLDLAGAASLEAFVAVVKTLDEQTLQQLRLVCSNLAAVQDWFSDNAVGTQAEVLGYQSAIYHGGRAVVTMGPQGDVILSVKFKMVRRGNEAEITWTHEQLLVREWQIEYHSHAPRI